MMQVYRSYSDFAKKHGLSLSKARRLFEHGYFREASFSWTYNYRITEHYIETKKRTRKFFVFLPEVLKDGYPIFDSITKGLKGEETPEE